MFNKDRVEWNEYFMILAKMVALRSTCLSRKVGAVLVKDKHILSAGYNGSIVGGEHCTDNDKCHRRSLGVTDKNKGDYCRSVHAEINAISQAAKFGINIRDSILYTTLAPCITCFKALVNSGVIKVYYEYLYESVNIERDKHWQNEIRKHMGMDIEKLILSEGDVQKAVSGLMSVTSKRKLRSE